MATQAANETRFSFTNAHLDADALQVVSFVGHEAISRPYRFEIDLVSKDPSVAFSDLVDQPATLAMEGADGPLYVHGLVADFQQGVPTGSFFRYHAVLVPRLWRLSLTFQSRIFQEQSVPEIVERILLDAGLAPDDFRFDLAGSYAPREYCVQFRETDLAFVSRLLEYEGIQFFFEQGSQRETLVLTDDRSHNPPIEGDETVVFRPTGGMAPAHEETVQAFVFREQIVTGKVVLKDYNYRTPETDLKAESQISDELPGTYSDYGAHFPDAGAGERLARVRNEEIECRRRVGTGESTCLRLRAGHRFTMEDHYRLDLNHDYLLTHVTHHGSQRGLVTMEAGQDTAPPYRNTFTCIPASVPFRPPRETPEPRLPGVMTARMESSGGDYAYLDDEGRYHARMHFDLRASGEAGEGEATLPVRMNQPYSGPGYGIHFPNHADTEMIWACVNGDPDRPLALGTVPNPSQNSPSTAANSPQNVIRTWGENELTFDDAKGEENIYMHATKNHTVEVTNDETISVGHDQALSVGNDQSFTVGNDRALSVGNDEGVQIGHDQAIGVGNDRDKTVGNNETESIGANKKISVGANHSESIGANKSLNVGANHSESVGANMTINVGASLTETVAVNYAETVGVAMELTVGAALSEIVGGERSEQVGSDQTVQIGGDRNEVVGGEHSEAVAKGYKVSAKKVTIVAEDEIVLKTGKASITMKKNGDITINGKKLTIKGSGDVVIKGKKILEN